MTVRTLTNNPIQENTYILSFADQTAVIIDCGAYEPFEQQRMADYIARNGLRPVAHLLTHGHFDHCFGVRFVWETYGLKPVLSEADAVLYQNRGRQMALFLGEDGNEAPFNEYIPAKDFDFRAIHAQLLPTPGHTPGGVCYLFREDGQQVLFSGDTLFSGSVGRTDLGGGNMLTLLDSIRRQLLTLPDLVTVYPGHGPHTTIGQERLHNLYLN